MYKYTQYNMKKKDLYKIQNTLFQYAAAGQTGWEDHVERKIQNTRAHTHTVFLFVVNEK